MPKAGHLLTDLSDQSQLGSNMGSKRPEPPPKVVTGKRPISPPPPKKKPSSVVALPASEYRPDREAIVKLVLVSPITGRWLEAVSDITVQDGVAKFVVGNRKERYLIEIKMSEL